MTIYILGTPEETAQELDDRSLDFMIKDIAQVLCNVHHKIIDDKNTCHCFEKDCPLVFEEHEKIPLESIVDITGLSEWILWAQECAANYKYLVELGEKCCAEFFWRFQEYENLEHHKKKEKIDKFNEAIIWSSINVPDLPAIPGMHNSDGRLSDGAFYDYIGKRDNGRFLGTPFPIVMPKRYHQEETAGNMIFGIIHSYQKYYQVQLKKQYNTGKQISPSWTRRQQPTWINLE